MAAETTATDTAWRFWLAEWVGKPGKWESAPLDAFAKDGQSLLPKIGGSMFLLALATSLGIWGLGRPVLPFLRGFLGVCLLVIVAYTMAGQKVVHHYNLEYALWALALGLLISNTAGVPRWLRPAACGEYYIKIGLVLYGAEILFSKLLALGGPGICVAWVVTPIVLVSTYIFGQRVLRLPSKSLNMVISADMSVCGVSAAIATSAACRAKKEELSLAVGDVSLSFTVVMMVVLPLVIQALRLDPRVGGAWLGGTIDSTGAVAAAGTALGPEAETVAVTVKMIQNILIGIVAFCVAVYWTRYVEIGDTEIRPDFREVWRRFPKFILGFVAASLLMSAIYVGIQDGPTFVNEGVISVTKQLRGWLFALAFVSIGLETNFRQLAPYLKSGKPLLLYLAGQSLNLLLTLIMAQIAFGWFFQ